MPSRRMIHPEFWKSETIGLLTVRQRLFFVGLFSNADDQGRLRASPPLLRSLIFPYDTIPDAKIKEDLEAIAETGSVQLYEAGGREYLQITKWWIYQTPQWAYPSLLPAPKGWKDKLRYRKDNAVITKNWHETKPKPKDKPNGNPLPKALPNGSGGPVSEYSVGLGIELGLGLTQNSLVESEGADAPDELPPQLNLCNVSKDIFQIAIKEGDPFISSLKKLEPPCTSENATSFIDWFLHIYLQKKPAHQKAMPTKRQITELWKQAFVALAGPNYDGYSKYVSVTPEL